MRLNFRTPEGKLSWKREKISPKPCLFHMISIKNRQRNYSTFSSVMYLLLLELAGSVPLVTISLDMILSQITSIYLLLLCPYLPNRFPYQNFYVLLIFLHTVLTYCSLYIQLSSMYSLLSVLR